MKTKKILAFLLAVILIFAGLPTITSSAAEAYNIGKWYHDFTRDNYTKSCYSTVFNLANDGVLKFYTDRFLDKNGNELNMTYNIYKYNNALGEKVWSVRSTHFGDNETAYERLVGLEKGSYILEVYPSIYSSSIPEGGALRLIFGLAFVDFDCYETESNDEKATADVMAFNQPMYGYTDNTEDYYSITVTKDTIARIKIKNYAKLCESGVYVKHISPAGKSQGLYSFNAAAASDHHYFDVLLSKGTNYINVTSFYKGQADYCLEVSDKVSVPAPVINNLKISGTKVEVSWKQLSGVTGYEIWRKINKGSWERVLKPGSNTIGFWQSGTNFSNTYQFKVRSFKTIGDTTLYSSWSKIKSLNPTPTNIKLSTSSYTYNGKKRTPKVTVKDKTGKTLKEGTHYTVSMASGRKKIGKYKVVITFKGDYTGKKTVYFKINPKKTSVSKVTAAKKSLKVKLKKQTSQTSGYQIQYSTSKKFKSAKTVTIKSNKTTSATIKSLKAKKTYYVRVRTYKTVSGTKFYSSWSSAKSKKTK